MLSSLRTQFTIWLLCLAALLLYGCSNGYKQAPAPVVDHHQRYMQKGKAPTQPNASHSFSEKQMEANSATPSQFAIMPITLKPVHTAASMPAKEPSEALSTSSTTPAKPDTLSLAREHRVRAGENIGMIAKSYNVSWRAIAEENHIPAPYYVQEGQLLKLPDHQLYMVQPGDTLLKLARDTGVSKEKIIADNKLTPPYLLEMGRSLRLPRQLLHLSQSQEISKAVQLKAPESFKNAQFAWPLRGKVIRHYGVSSHGIHNDGINIQAPLGAPIKAAASGEVVYAGNGLKAFGNLIIIKHNNKWLSAYAHQKEIIVSEGAQVSKGQIIGYVGTTGGVTEPQLHFSIRNGKKPVDPEQYLKG